MASCLICWIIFIQLVVLCHQWCQVSLSVLCTVVVDHYYATWPLCLTSSAPLTTLSLSSLYWDTSCSQQTHQHLLQQQHTQEWLSFSCTCLNCHTCSFIAFTHGTHSSIVWCMTRSKLATEPFKHIHAHPMFYYMCHPIVAFTLHIY